jgi:hypothetical protein
VSTVSLQLAALASLAFSTARPAQTPERYTLSGDRVAIHNLAGVLSVEAGTGSQVVIEVTRGGAGAASLAVKTGQLGQEETLRIIYPDSRVVYPPLGRNSSTSLRVGDDGTLDHDRSGGRKVTISGDGPGLDAHADLRVLLPPGRHAAFHLGSGRISIANVNGELRASTASGDVSAADYHGSLDVETGSGDVNVKDGDGSLAIETGSGDVTLSRIRGDELRVETGSGDVAADDVSTGRMSWEAGSGDLTLTGGAGTVRAETGSGDVKLDLSGALARLDLEAGTGDVSVKLPAQFAGDLRIETGGGDDLEIGFPVQLVRKGDSEFHARIGDGNGEIRIGTGSGKVTLTR